MYNNVQPTELLNFNPSHFFNFPLVLLAVINNNINVCVIDFGGTSCGYLLLWKYCTDLLPAILNRRPISTEYCQACSNTLGME